MVCTRCGKKIGDGELICTACGAVVGSGGEGSPRGAQEAPARQSAGFANAGGSPETANSLDREGHGFLPAWLETIFASLKALILRLFRIAIIFVVVVAVYVAVFLARNWDAISTGGFGMEGDIKRTFKASIQEHVIDDNKMGAYISLDKIEEFEVHKKPSGSKDWTGTATVRFKGKRGSAKGETVSVRYDIESEDRGKDVLVQSEASNVEELLRLLSLLERCGFDLNDLDLDDGDI